MLESGYFPDLFSLACSFLSEVLVLSCHPLHLYKYNNKRNPYQVDQKEMQKHWLLHKDQYHVFVFVCVWDSGVYCTLDCSLVPVILQF